jgi:hypothetical protein
VPHLVRWRGRPCVKHATASPKLQTTLAIQSWLRDWRIKSNETKSVHVTLTTRRGTCPPVHINDVELPQENHVKYLGLHLDRRLTWHTHNFSKSKQLGLFAHQDVLVTRAQVQTLYQQQTPHLQSNTHSHSNYLSLVITAMRFRINWIF